MMEMGELTKVENELPVSSEATRIEQARAFGEVAVQAELAKRFPREMDKVFERIDQTFELSPALIAASKFEYPRGNERVIGYSIQFARAVASCVGNIHYSVKELARHENQTEMLCYAWDLETNSMQTRSFIVSHTRYGASNKTPLTKERDIYENNSNVGGRRVRECLLGVLPASAVKYAENKVEELIKKAFPSEKQKIYADRNIDRFATINVTRDDLVRNRGNRPPETWTKNDFATFATYWDSIEKGVSTVDEIFGDKQPPQIADSQASQSAKVIDKFKPKGDIEKSGPAEDVQHTNPEPGPVDEQSYVDKLRLLVNDPKYKKAIEDCIKSEEFMATSLTTTDEKTAEAVYNSIIKVQGFIDADNKNDDVDSHF